MLEHSIKRLSVAWFAYYQYQLPSWEIYCLCLVLKELQCTVTWNSDLEMIVYIVFSCILENDLFVKREECVSLSFQCQFVALNNNDHGMAKDLIRDPMKKIGLCLWMVNISLQQVNVTIVLNTFEVGC